MDPSKVASLNPDTFVQGGLQDDFDGVITKVRYCPWDYNGNIDHHVLAVAVTIKPDDPEIEEFVQHYSAGDLEQFVPSMDGDNAVDLSVDTNEETNPGFSPDQLEGIYALRVGKKEGLANSSNWATFIRAAIDAGFPVASLTPSVACFEQHRGHFNRIPQKKRAGLVETDAQKAKNRNKEILVMTEYKGAAEGAAKPKVAPKAAAAKATPATKAAPAAPATPAAATGTLDEKLVAIVVAGLAANDGSLPKSSLAKLALNGLAGVEKAKGVKRVVEQEFLEGNEESWVFDGDSGTLIATS